MIIIQADPRTPSIVTLIRELDQHLATLYPPDSIFGLNLDELSARDVRFFAALEDENALGCGAIKLFKEYAEIKRVYVAPEARGTGVARALLNRLEQIARNIGYDRLRLDTGPEQPASVALFTSIGYEQIPDYNGNPVGAYWFEKRLA